MSIIRHLKTFGHLKTYINRYDVWVPHNLTEKKFNGPHFHLRFFAQTQRKWSIFETNNHGRCKMDCLHQCGTKKILGKTIWATINRSKGRSASEEGDAVYLVGLEGHHVLRTPSTQPKIINSDKYCSQLDWLKAAIDEKRPELANRKGVWSSIRTTSDLTSRCISGKNWCNLTGMSYLTHHIYPILHLQMTTYSGLYRIPLMERTSILWKLVKTT